MEHVDFLTQEIIRLLGEIKGKRILELGIARDCVSHMLVAQGASPILVEESPDVVARVKSSDLYGEFKFEVRQSRLADLAFCPAESIDAAFSVISLAGTADLARLFRQLQRVLKSQGTFAFGLVHPMAFIQHSQTPASEQIRYRSKEPLDSAALKCRFPVPLPEKVRQISFGETFSQLKRAGLSIDQLLEIPEESEQDALTDPTLLVIRARK